MSEVSHRLYGKLAACLVTFESSGEIIKVSFGKSESTWFEEVDQLRLSRQPHLFFDPLNLPDYIWLSWLGAHKSSIERLVGSAFTSSDFQPIIATPQDQAHQAPRALSDFPSVWEVIFERA